MRNTTLVVAALMLAFAGCNTCGNSCSSGRPNLFGRLGSCFGGANNVGAPCDASGGGASAAGAHCDPCTETARYGGYGEQVIGTSYGAPMSSSIDGVPIGSSATTLPPGAYIGSPTPAASSRGEVIRPKPAN